MSPENPKVLSVEIWSDIACPWCYIGKRRFETALAGFEHADELNITWRSYELNPDAPAEMVGDMAEKIAKKYGITVEEARVAEANLVATAAGEGLDYRFDIRRSGNTFDGHRLIHLAAEHGLGDAMKERLLAAYFCEGELISDHAALARLGAEVGLDSDEVAAMLASDAYADAVRADERAGLEMGVRGVPTFIVERQVGVSGAQPPEMLLDMLQQAWERRRPVIAGADGEACGIDGC